VGFTGRTRLTAHEGCEAKGTNEGGSENKNG